MSGLKRKLVIKDLGHATEIIEDLIERIEELEKHVKVVYHKQNTTSRAVGASMHDVNTSLTNVNRQITQNRKK